jgi:protein SCO1/2
LFAFRRRTAGGGVTRQARWIVATVCLALAVILAGYTGWRVFSRGESAPAVGGPFRLTDQDGARVDETILKGKWTLVFFGYTYCPEACPTTLTTLAKAIDEMGPQGRDVQVVFVSIDPARDTPAQLKSYLSSAAFPKATRGLTGSAADVAGIAHAYHVYYQKSGSGADYSMDHSTAIYLMDPRGRFTHVIPYGIPPEEVKRQIADAKREA